MKQTLENTGKWFTENFSEMQPNTVKYFTEIIFCKIFYGKTNIQLTLYTLLYEDNCLEI